MSKGEHPNQPKSTKATKDGLLGESSEVGHQSSTKDTWDIASSIATILASFVATLALVLLTIQIIGNSRDSQEQFRLMSDQNINAQKQIEQNNIRVAQNTEELKKIALQNRITAQGVLYSHATDVTKAFLQDDNFKFAKYFYLGSEQDVAALPNEADLDFKVRLDLLCELHTDLFENVIQHLDALTESDANSWRDYIQIVYKRTRSMRDYLRSYEKCYSGELFTMSRISIDYSDEINTYKSIEFTSALSESK